MNRALKLPWLFLLFFASFGLFGFSPYSVNADFRKSARESREVQARLTKIYRFLRSNPRKAVINLNKLLKEYPRQERIVLERLGYAYSLVGAVDSAMIAYEKCLRFNPINLKAAGELAQLYINHGKDEEARQLFEQILARSSKKVMGYRAVAKAQSASGWHDEAIATYMEARAILGDERSFALEIADIYKLLGNWEDALNEYLLCYSERKGGLGSVKRRILDLIERSKKNGEKLVAILEEKAAPGDAFFRRSVLEILSDVYLARGLLEKALNASLEADGLGSANGRELFSLIRKLHSNSQRKAIADKRRLLETCLRAAEAYLVRHPQSLDVPGAYLVHAEVLVELSGLPVRPKEEAEEMISRALNSYNIVLARSSGGKFAERAALEKGDLLAFHLGRFEEALSIYQRGRRRNGELEVDFAERIVKTLISINRVDEAKAFCSSLIRSPDPRLSETGLYHQGMLLTFDGDYQSARDTLTSLAEKDPSLRYANDAIDLAWVIEIGLRSDPQILGKYIASMKAETTGDIIGAVRILEDFAQGPTGIPLRPRALYRLGAIYLERREFSKALATYEEFLKDYPEDQLAPGVERKIGEVYEFGLGKRDRALKMYEHVLMSYPEYVFLDEVRKDILRLRSEGKAQ